MNIFNLKKNIAIQFLLLILFAGFAFYTKGNTYYYNNDPFLLYFQADSDSLIQQYIDAESHDVDTLGFGYGNLTVDNDGTTKFQPGISNYGLQGRFFSFLYNRIQIRSINSFRFLLSLLLAIIISAISVLLYLRINKILGFVFYWCCVFSPWVTGMASNLYWVEFLLFLPMLISLLIVSSKNSPTSLYIFFFLAILIKSLCGYEFISTVGLSAISLPIYFWILEQDKEARKRKFHTILKLGSLFVIGFCCALLLHSTLRGESVPQGLKSIFLQDVLRRTYGVPGSFPEVYKDSLLVSPLRVLYSYFYQYNTDLVFGIPGKFLPLLTIINIYIIIISFKNKSGRHYASLFAIFFCVSTSWLLLAKAHSYIHTHINFIVFYFGFIQILFYIPLHYTWTQLLKNHRRT